MISRTISNRYGQKLNDVNEWLSLTDWSQDNIDQNTIDTVQNELLALDIIPEKKQYHELVSVI
jgi:hypothetical protein